jgi:hypothetical protein
MAAALFPQVEFVHNFPALHVAFETAGALIALLAGFLIAGRFLRRARLTELVLVCSFGGLALCELAFATVPLHPGHGSADLPVWAALGGRAFGAVLFALAVFLPGRRLHRPGRALGIGAALVAVTPLLMAAAAVSFAPGLPGPTVAAPGLAGPASGPNAANILLRSELGLAMVYGLAAAGFLRRAERSHDEFDGWLAAAAVLAGTSHLNYFLYPGMYSQLFSLGDVFRFCSCAVLLAGSAREISSYWQALPRATAAAEQRRIAHDLRDGLGEELEYLLRNIDSLDGPAATEMGAHLRRAAERAQLAAHQAISRLAGPRGEPVSSIAGAADDDRRAGARTIRLRLRPRVPYLAGTWPRLREAAHLMNNSDAELIRRMARAQKRIFRILLVKDRCLHGSWASCEPSGGGARPLIVSLPAASLAGSGELRNLNDCSACHESGMNRARVNRSR